MLDMSKLKPAYLYITVGVALILGWFYWYEYRPMQVRIKCAEEALDKARERGPGDGRYTLYDREHYYIRCLDEAGLERKFGDRGAA